MDYGVKIISKVKEFNEAMDEVSYSPDVVWTEPPHLLTQGHRLSSNQLTMLQGVSWCILLLN